MDSPPAPVPESLFSQGHPSRSVRWGHPSPSQQGPPVRLRGRACGSWLPVGDGASHRVPVPGWVPVSPFFKLLYGSGQQMRQPTPPTLTAETAMPWQIGGRG